MLTSTLKVWVGLHLSVKIWVEFHFRVKIFLLRFSRGSSEFDHNPYGSFDLKYASSKSGFQVTSSHEMFELDYTSLNIWITLHSRVEIWVGLHLSAKRLTRYTFVWKVKGLFPVVVLVKLYLRSKVLGQTTFHHVRLSCVTSLRERFELDYTSP